MRQKDAERAEAIEQLRKTLKPGDTVYSVLRHVSSSGMSRRIDLYALQAREPGGKCEPVFLSGYAAKAMNMRHEYRKGGIVISGCGMDMGFALVYDLSRTLFPDGFIPAKAGTHGRNGEPDNKRDTDGGYALKHSWL